MSAFASFVDFLLPILLQLLGLVIGGLLLSLSQLARRRWGIEIEAAHRDALHSALMSGVRAAVARGLNGQAATAAAVAYAGRSVPDALTALNPGEGVLVSIAEAKLTEASGGAAPSSRAPRRSRAFGLIRAGASGPLRPRRILGPARSASIRAGGRRRFTTALPRRPASRVRSRGAARGRDLRRAPRPSPRRAAHGSAEGGGGEAGAGG
ncbi:hypothetical protein [Neomegalonema sp.]|uniref:hypothetical protein n=1 Tax=Neomegalonema sp. TaxID=2039713 RepID=UPI0026070F95|nr:hypothetical protein [Neomegalonema sp.]MDD2870101.1 hypothetical protein [Neomegalonema sp.]